MHADNLNVTVSQFFWYLSVLVCEIQLATTDRSCVLCEMEITCLFMIQILLNSDF